MLEHLLDDYSVSFGTRDEKLEKESTIRQIERLNTEGSDVSKAGYDFLDLPDDVSNMEVSEGDLPSYDQIPGFREDEVNSVNIRKSHVSTKKGWDADDRTKAISGKTPNVNLDVGLGMTGPEDDFATRLRLRKKTKRSLHHHRHYHRYWRPRYFHARSYQFSPYYDFPDEQEPFEPIPRISQFLDFPRFPTPQRLPRFPMSLMTERFIPYPHLPKIEESFPPPLEKLERLPEPPPIPQAILGREETGTREAEPVDEWAPLPEPVPAPEPPPILEPPPIPELAPIKEIPPIPEPQAKTPPNLDPKKTFGTGESNGGVKKSIGGI